MRHPPGHDPHAPLAPDDPAKLRRDAHVLLASVRSTLADLLDLVRDGEGGALRDLGLKQAELETALKRAFDAEGRFDDWQAKQGHQAEADAQAGEIDFAALRHDIACRLARLRECCQDD